MKKLKQRTKNTHPFILKVFIPKGQPFGMKTRDDIRQFVFKTEDDAIKNFNFFSFKLCYKICLFKNRLTDQDIIVND